MFGGELENGLCARNNDLNTELRLQNQDIDPGIRGVPRINAQIS
jgi:hypothetical protein